MSVRYEYKVEDNVDGWVEGDYPLHRSLKSAEEELTRLRADYKDSRTEVEFWIERRTKWVRI